MAHYYYWNDDFRTPEGLSLQQCLEQFGTQLVAFRDRRSRQMFKYKVVHLDGQRSLGNSWMLWFKGRKGENIPVALYESDAQRVSGFI
jgi:hypothetical protein